jgi:outer membrane protein assembly factor BamB
MNLPVAVRSSRVAVLIVAVWLVIEESGSRVRAEDWSMLGRDATRNPVSPEKQPPLWWQFGFRDEGLSQPDRNIKWKAWLGRRCICEPVVAGGLVFVGTDNGRPRDPRQKMPAAALMCFRESDGKFLYQYLSRALPGERGQDWNYAGHSSSPVVVGDRAWFTTIRAEVVCLDIGPLRRGDGSAREVWKLDMQKAFGIFPGGAPMGWAKTCSLSAPFEDRLFVLTGNACDEDEDKTPMPKAPSLVCLHKDTGAVLWQDNSPGKDLLPGQWASPLIVKVNGQGQVIAPQGDGWVRSFDPRTGKVLWQFNTNPPGSKRSVRNNVLATPVFHDNRVYIANGRLPDDPQPPRHAWLYCLDPTRRGDISPELKDDAGKSKPNSNSGMIWRFGGEKPNKRPVFLGSLSSPAIAGGLLFTVETGGWCHSLDARTGKHYWTFDLEDTAIGSPLIVGDQVYVAGHGAIHRLGLSAAPEVAMRRVQGKDRALARIDAAYGILASPVFANGVMHLATRDTLYAIKAENGVESRQGFWPQWRGPGRTNVAPAEGLMRSWPKEGPPLVWKANELGEGVQSLAVAGGRIFMLGYHDNNEHMTALAEETGQLLWQKCIGPGVKFFGGMRWLNQRTPTVDGERLYAVSVHGELVCLAVTDGKEVWRKSYKDDFAGKPGSWGFCDYPLVDGDKLICTPAGPTATVVALDKRTGKLLWKCAVPGERQGTEAAIIVAQSGGVRHYIHQLASAGTVGISEEGKLLWRYPKTADSRGNVNTALVKGDLVLCTNGWGPKAGLIRLVRKDNDLVVEDVYHKPVRLDPWLGSSVLIGDHVYAANGVCFNFMTGEMVDRLPAARSFPRMTMCCAGRLLVHRLPDGRVILSEATAKGFDVKGTFQVPRFSKEITWTFPVIAGGKLYLRDQEVLLCYDLRDQPRKKHRLPDAIFVPTPQDVVEKMLEVARVKKEDVVYDLGCGDGRIVATAARKYGCKAVGYDLDPYCVKLAGDRIAQEKLGSLVTIQRQDLFTANLQPATVITLYLGSSLNARLIPQLDKVKPGTRIVSHDFDMPGVRPDQVVRVVSREDGVEHRIYLWTAPLKR